MSVKGESLIYALTGKGQLTTEEFPFDLDTTSLGLTILQHDKDTAHSVMDEMLEYVDHDGIIQVSVVTPTKTSDLPELIYVSPRAVALIYLSYNQTRCDHVHRPTSTTADPASTPSSASTHSASSTPTPAVPNSTKP
jgi:hypothetical protein